MSDRIGVYTGNPGFKFTFMQLKQQKKLRDECEKFKFRQKKCCLQYRLKED
jgi:hypothetical protein